MKTLSLLGSTGSIGCSVLAVVRQFPERFRIIALAAGRNIELLAKQIEEFRPQVASVAEPELVRPLCALLPPACRTEILYGNEGNCVAARLPEVEMTISAIVGAAGLLPTMAAIQSGKTIGLANKECLVMAGPLMMNEAKRQGLRILPIDSEHNAIFQALEAGRPQDVERIILTASGGPFRNWSKEEILHARPDQALAHPNWSMGRKISIDSATLMNKGLEVIEARWLFNLPPEQISVLVHPQSIVHSLVEYQDGSVMAQMGIADMRIPIAYALSYPERLPLALPRLRLSQAEDLSFSKPDDERFPALQLAYDSLNMDDLAPARLNAANEMAVEAFLAGRIHFPHIAEIAAEVLTQTRSGAQIPTEGQKADLQAVLAADQAARVLAAASIQAREIAC